MLEYSRKLVTTAAATTIPFRTCSKLNDDSSSTQTGRDVGIHWGQEPQPVSWPASRRCRSWRVSPVWVRSAPRGRPRPDSQAGSAASSRSCSGSSGYTALPGARGGGGHRGSERLHRGQRGHKEVREVTQGPERPHRSCTDRSGRQTDRQTKMLLLPGW